MENLRVRSEKLKTEQALRRREEHQSIVLQSLPIALYTASLQEDHRQLHFTNDSIERITGFKPEAFLEQRGFLVVPPPPGGSRARARAAQTVCRRRAPSRWNIAGDAPTAPTAISSIRPSSCATTTGSPREFFGMWFDITERKQLEQNLLHASKLEAVGRLTGRHRARLQQHAERRDRQSRPPAEVGRGQRAGAQRRAKMAMEGAQRCADLTHRLLAFSRRQPLQASTIDVEHPHAGPARTDAPDAGRAHQCAAQRPTRRSGRSGSIGRSSRRPSSTWRSMPATPCRTAAISRSRSRTGPWRRAAPRRGDYVVISVSDTGTGMPPEVLERVFEPFFTTKESGKGTGLGLSMVYGFVQQSRGHVEVDSAAAITARRSGSSCRGPTERRRSSCPRSKSEVARPFGEGQTVLVVEDDPAVRQVAVSTLRSLGFEVTEAQNGDEAALLLRDNEHVRLVLSDVRMPGELTGIDLARIVKRDCRACRFSSPRAMWTAKRRSTISNSSTSPTARRISPSGFNCCSRRLRSRLPRRRQRQVDRRFRARPRTALRPRGRPTGAFAGPDLSEASA